MKLSPQDDKRRFSEILPIHMAHQKVFDPLGSARNLSMEVGSPPHDAQIRRWEFDNFSSDHRNNRRPSIDLDHEREYVTRKSIRSPPRTPGGLPSDSPVPLPMYVVKPQHSENHGKPATKEEMFNETILMLQIELKRLKNENMAAKWENDELKCENRRFKMYNEELTKHQKKMTQENDQIKRDHVTDQVKYKEFFGEFSKTVSKLEDENKYLRTVASLQHKIPRAISQTLDESPMILHPLAKVSDKAIDPSWINICLPKLEMRPKNTIANLID